MKCTIFTPADSEQVCCWCPHPSSNHPRTYCFQCHGARSVDRFTLAPVPIGVKPVLGATIRCPSCDGAAVVDNPEFSGEQREQRDRLW